MNKFNFNVQMVVTVNVNASELTVYLILCQHAIVRWVRSTLAFLVDRTNRDLIFKVD